MQIWNISTQKKEWEIDTDAYPVDVCWSPDGSLIACSNIVFCVCLYSTTSGCLTHSLRATFEIEYIAWSPDGSRVLASMGEGDDDRIKFCTWNATNGASETIVDSVGAGGSLFAKRYGKQYANISRMRLLSPNGERVAAVYASHTFIANGITDVRREYNWGGVFNRSHNVMWSPDSTRICYAGFDYTPRIDVACAWNDRLNYVFDSKTKSVVFVMMCIKHRIETCTEMCLFPVLPMILWISILEITFVQKYDE
jgi:hypothetical protein